MKWQIAVGLMLLVFGSGCASILGSKEQTISIEAISKGNKIEKLEDVQCSLKNDKGNWSVKAPGAVIVNKSIGNLDVKCEKEPYPAGEVTVEAKGNMLVYGNILFLGVGTVIGAAQDEKTGAGYDYPTYIQVVMGEIIKPQNIPENLPEGTADLPVKKSVLEKRDEPLPQPPLITAKIQPQSAPVQSPPQPPPTETQPQSAPIQPTSPPQSTPQVQALNQSSMEEPKNEKTPDNECPIKGKVSFKKGIFIYDKEGKRQGEKLYYLPGNPKYQEIVIDAKSEDRWFCTEGDAKRAGFRLTATTTKK